MSSSVTPAEDFRQAILACRAERWREGLELLTRVAQNAERRGNLPGMFYSYLGLAMARCEGRRREGLELCRHAVREQPDEPDNHLNLAYVYLTLGRRESAVQALRSGLLKEPRHERLLALHDRLGVRDEPPLRFLPRSHVLNIQLGRARHWWRTRQAERRAAHEEDGEAIDS
jgi:hypothetical protein